MVWLVFVSFVLLRWGLGGANGAYKHICARSKPFAFGAYRVPVAVVVVAGGRLVIDASCTLNEMKCGETRDACLRSAWSATRDTLCLVVTLVPAMSATPVAWPVTSVAVSAQLRPAVRR